MEYPEQTKELYESLHEHDGKGMKGYNKDIHLQMLREIEAAADKIRKRYIEKYGKCAIIPSLFDIAESEVHPDEEG